MRLRSNNKLTRIPDELANSMHDLSHDHQFDDPQQSEQLVRENIGWMLTLAKRMLSDHAHAEDVVQDAFIAAFRARESFEGRSTIKTWLHRITVNAALMKLRQLKRLREDDIEAYLPQFDRYDCRIEAPWPRRSPVEITFDNKRLRELVSTKIALLPDAYRIVLELRDIQGYDTVEVAEVLDISVSNVKVRLHRARSALKKLLEPFLRGEEGI